MGIGLLENGSEVELGDANRHGGWGKTRCGHVTSSQPKLRKYPLIIAPEHYPRWPRFLAYPPSPAPVFIHRPRSRLPGFQITAGIFIWRPPRAFHQQRVTTTFEWAPQSRLVLTPTISEWKQLALVEARQPFDITSFSLGRKLWWKAPKSGESPL